MNSILKGHIYVAVHEVLELPHNDLYKPILVGASCLEPGQDLPDYYLRDDTGYHISEISLVCYMTNYLIAIDGICSEDKSQVFFKAFSVVNMTAIFITVRYFCHKIVFHECVSKWIIYFGRATFGIYLLHVLILDMLNYKLRINGLLLWDIFKVKLHFNPMLSAWLIVLIILCLGAAVTDFLKRIPLLKQIL